MPETVHPLPVAGKDFVRIGKVLRPHGLRGVVRVEAYTACRENLLAYSRIFLSAPDDTKKREYTVEQAKLSGRMLLLRLKGCRSRDDAELLRGSSIWLDSHDLPQLDPGEIYLHTLTGKVALNDDGRELGRIAAVLETKAHAVLVVRHGGREFLIPAVTAFITRVDGDAVTFTLPEGLLEINAGI